MMNVMNRRVRITEVGARDGLQNEAAIVPFTSKAQLIQRIASMRPDEIEVTSFVSPKWIPQLGDAEQLLESLEPIDCEVSALVPNEQGMLRLLDVNCKARARHGRNMVSKVSVFAAASEGFSRKNTNASVAEVVERFKPVIALAREHGLRTRGYVSCVIRCPIDGKIEPERVASVVRKLLEIGIEEIDLGDTIGAATPETITSMLNAVRGEFSANRMSGLSKEWRDLDAPPLTVHLHDTFGRARECVIECLSQGVRSFDSSVAGLGGCPYAGTSTQRAPGNISTETLVDTIRSQGFECGILDDRLADAAAFARKLVAGNTQP